MSNVAINIAAEFTGKKAFKEADSAATKLNKNVKMLAGSIGLAYGTRALINFGKTAVKEFSDAQHEAVVLSNTVKNLGLSFAQPEITAYIDEISRLYGVTGGQAVPAMQALLSATGSVAKSTEIMNLALDIAASRNMDVTDVAKGLSQAYIGNTKALKKYDLGLTAAELKTKTFADIQLILSQRMAGAASASAETLAGKMLILAEASNQAKESIGANLVDAFARISGGSETKDAIDTINSLTSAFNGLVTAISIIPTGLLKLYRALDKVTTFNGLIGANGTLSTMFDASPKTNRSSSPAGTWKRIQLTKKAELEAIKRNKELAKLAKSQAKSAADALKKKKEQAALDKAALMLATGTDVFDQQAVELNAAMLNQTKQLGAVTSQTQLLAVAGDVARLKVKQDILDLEKAIQAGDAAAATAAAAKLSADLGSLAALTGQDLKLSSIKKILESLTSTKLIDQANLDEALRKIKEIAAAAPTYKGPTGGLPMAGAGAGVSQIISTVDQQVAFIDQLVAANNQLMADIQSSGAYQTAQKVEVALKITGDGELTNTIAKNLMNQSLSSGNQAYINRRTGGFE